MAARRLLIVMLLLLGFSILATSQVPEERRLRDRTETAEAERETTTADAPPSARHVARTIAVGGRTLPVVPVRLGDQLSLVVRSKLAAQIEVPRLGLVQAVDPFSPARFDIIAPQSGVYPIRIVETGAIVARIEVSERAGPRPRARGGTARAPAGGRP